jgi:hypothetical protein
MVCEESRRDFTELKLELSGASYDAYHDYGVLISEIRGSGLGGTLCDLAAWLG